MIRLGVNIDHVATVRNARGENYPDPYKAAILAKAAGANSITIHLREDRRHISDKDLFKIVRLKKVRVNLEMAPTKEMLKIALKSKPKYVCIVPEKRQELTTEGGLKLDNQSYSPEPIQDGQDYFNFKLPIKIFSDNTTSLMINYKNTIYLNLFCLQ